MFAKDNIFFFFKNTIDKSVKSVLLILITNTFKKATKVNIIDKKHAPYLQKSLFLSQTAYFLY